MVPSWSEIKSQPWFSQLSPEQQAQSLDLWSQDMQKEIGDDAEQLDLLGATTDLEKRSLFGEQVPTLDQYLPEYKARKQADQQGFLSQMGGALKTGFQDTMTGLGVTFDTLTGDNEELAQGLAAMNETQRERQANTTSKDLALEKALAENAKQFKEAKGFWPTTKELIDYAGIALTNPQAMTKMALESAPNALVSIGATTAGGVLGAAGGPAGIAAGAVAGGSAANIPLEIPGAIYQSLMEATEGQAGSWNPTQIKEFLDANPQVKEAGLERGAIRGAAIGVVEGLTAGLAGRVATIPERAAEKAVLRSVGKQLGKEIASPVDVADFIRAGGKEAEQQLANVAADTLGQFSKAQRAGALAGGAALETAGEGLGEFVAQKAAGEETDPTAIFQEMAAGGILSGLGVAGARIASLPGKIVNADPELRQQAQSIQNAAELVQQAATDPNASAAAAAAKAVINEATSNMEEKAAVMLNDVSSGLEDLGTVEGNLLARVPLAKPRGGEISAPETVLEGQNYEQGQPTPEPQPETTPVRPEQPPAQAPETDVGGGVASGAGMTQRDTSKPEQMTPEDLSLANTIYDETTAQVGKRSTEELRALELKMRLNEPAFKEGMEDAQAAYNKIADVLEGRDNIESLSPVSEYIVDAYGIPLPEGYVRQGDLYVFAPEAPAAPAPKAEPEQGAGMTRPKIKDRRDSVPVEDRADYDEFMSLMERRGPAQSKVKGFKFTKADENRFQELGKKLRKYLFETVDPSTDPVIWKDTSGQDIHLSAKGTLYTVEKGRVRTGVDFGSDRFVRGFTPKPIPADFVEKADAADLLPEGYVRQGDLYVFAPEAPPTQTETQPKPEDASKNQVEETGGTPPVESQPPQTRPEVQAQEGAAQRSREGEEVAQREVTEEQISNKLDELFNAPTKATKKPAVVFKTQTEKAAFSQGFRAATKKQGSPPPDRLPNRSPKDQKWDEAWHKGWASGQTFVRSLPEVTPQGVVPTAPLPEGQPMPGGSGAPYRRVSSLKEIQELKASQGIPARREQAEAKLLKEATPADLPDESGRFGPDPLDPEGGPASGFITDTVGIISQVLHRKMAQKQRILPEEAEVLWNEKDAIRYAWTQEFSSNNRRHRSEWLRGWKELFYPFEAPATSGSGSFEDILTAKEFLQSEGVSLPASVASQTPPTGETQTPLSVESSRQTAAPSIPADVLLAGNVADEFSPSEAHQQVFEAVKSLDAVQLSDWLVENAPTEADREIAKRVAVKLRQRIDAGANVSVIWHTGESRPTRMRDSRGQVVTEPRFPGERAELTVNFNAPALFQDQINFPSGARYVTMLHELTHAALPDSALADLQPLFQKVVQHFNASDRTLPIEQRIFSRQINALQSVEELFAWGISDAEFQKYLASIQISQTETAWSAFVQFIRKALGLDKKYTSALDELMRVSETVFSQTADETMRRVEADNKAYGLNVEQQLRNANPPGITDDQELHPSWAKNTRYGQVAYSDNQGLAIIRGRARSGEEIFLPRKKKAIGVVQFTRDVSNLSPDEDLTQEEIDKLRGIVEQIKSGKVIPQVVETPPTRIKQTLLSEISALSESGKSKWTPEVIAAAEDYVQTGNPESYAKLNKTQKSLANRVRQQLGIQDEQDEMESERQKRIAASKAQTPSTYSPRQIEQSADIPTAQVVGRVSEADFQKGLDIVGNLIRNARATVISDSLANLLSRSDITEAEKDAFRKGAQGIYSNGRAIIARDSIRQTVLHTTPSQAAAAVIFHELMHKGSDILRNDPRLAESYAEWRSMLDENVTDDMLDAMVRRRGYTAWSDWRTNPTSKLRAQEEIFVRQMEDFFNRKGDLLAQEQTVFTRFLSWIKGLVEKVLGTPIEGRFKDAILEDWGRKFINAVQTSNSVSADIAMSMAEQDAEYLAAVEAGDNGNDSLVDQLRKSFLPSDTHAARETLAKAVSDVWAMNNPKSAAKLRAMIDAQAVAAGVYSEDGRQPMLFYRGGTEAGKMSYPGTSFWTPVKAVAEDYAKDAGDFLGMDIGRKNAAARNTQVIDALLKDGVPDDLVRAVGYTAIEKLVGAPVGAADGWFEAYLDSARGSAQNQTASRQRLIAALDAFLKSDTADHARDLLRLTKEAAPAMSLQDDSTTPGAYRTLHNLLTGVPEGAPAELAALKRAYVDDLEKMGAGEVVSLTRSATDPGAYFAPFRSVRRVGLILGDKIKRTSETGVITRDSVAQAQKEGFTAWWNDKAVGGATLGRDNRAAEVVPLGAVEGSVKSLELVNLDNSGNVILLSQRFNPESSDIRYSIESPVTDTRTGTDRLATFEQAEKDALKDYMKGNPPFDKLKQFLGLEEAAELGQVESILPLKMAAMDTIGFNEDKGENPIVSKQATANAYEIAEKLTTNSGFGVEYQQAIGPESAATAVLQMELLRYALALSRKGDNRLLSMLRKNWNSIVLGKYITATTSGRILGVRSNYVSEVLRTIDRMDSEMKKTAVEKVRQDGIPQEQAEGIVRDLDAIIKQAQIDYEELTKNFAGIESSVPSVDPYAWIERAVGKIEAEDQALVAKLFRDLARLDKMEAKREEFKKAANAPEASFLDDIYNEEMDIPNSPEELDAEIDQTKARISETLKKLNKKPEALKKVKEKLPKKSKALGMTDVEKVIEEQEKRLKTTPGPKAPLKESLRQLIRANMKADMGRENFVAEAAKFGATEAQANTLYDRSVVEADLLNAEKGKPITKFSKLLAYIKSNPALISDPASRSAAIQGFLIDNGYTEEQAKRMQSLVEPLIQKASVKAKQQALDRAVAVAKKKEEAKATPVEKNLGNKIGALSENSFKLLESDLKKIRMGLGDLEADPSQSLASALGFNGFRPTDYQALSELDAKITQAAKDGRPHDMAEGLRELYELLGRRRAPKTLLEVLAVAYNNSALSSVGTLAINVVAPSGSLISRVLLDLGRATALGKWSEVGDIANILADSFKKIAKEAEYGLLGGASTVAMNQQVQRVTSLQRDFNEALSVLRGTGRNTPEKRKQAGLSAKPSAMEKTKAAYTVMLATTDIVRRVLATTDHTWSAVLQNYFLKTQAVKVLDGRVPREAYIPALFNIGTNVSQTLTFENGTINGFAQQMGELKKAGNFTKEALLELTQTPAAEGLSSDAVTFDRDFKGAMRRVITAYDTPEAIERHLLNALRRQRNEAALRANDRMKLDVLNFLNETVPGSAEAVQKFIENETEYEMGTHQGEEAPTPDFMNGFTNLVRAAGQSITAKNPILGRMVVGYFGVPANLLNRAMWYTPYGIYRYFLGSAAAKNLATKGKFYQQSMETQAQINQRLVEALAGTAGVMALLALKSMDEDDDEGFNITLSGPTNKTEKDAWKKMGHRQGSIEYVTKDGTVTSLNWARGPFEPLKIALMMVGAMDDMRLNRKLGDGALGSSISDYLSAMFYGWSKQAAFFGAKNTIGAVLAPAPDASLASSLLYSVGPVVPYSGAISSVERFLVGPERFYGREGAIYLNLPIARSLLTERAVNALGDPQGLVPSSAWSSLNDRAWYAGLPIMVSGQPTGNDKLVYDFILRRGTGPGLPQRAQLENENGNLWDSQWLDYVAARGRIVKTEMIRQLPRLERMDDEDLSKALGEISSKATREAKRQFGYK